MVKGKEPTARLLRSIPLGFNGIEDSVDELLSAWLETDDAFNSSLTLFISIMYRGWKLPLDLRFIASAQLLEALSNYQVNVEALPEEDFRHYRYEVLHSIKDRTIKQWATSRLQGNRKGQTKLLKELISRHQTLAEWTVCNTDSFVAMHVKMRNHFTHRGTTDNASFSNEQLAWHTEGVLLLCYVIIGELLGLLPEKLIGLLRKTSFRSGIREKLRQLYPAKK